MIFITTRGTLSASILSYEPMKTQLPYLLLAAALVAIGLLVHPAEAPAQSGEDPAVISALADVASQQAAIQENQKNIDIKIAAVAEDVRQARLFAARGGK